MSEMSAESVNWPMQVERVSRWALVAIAVIGFDHQGIRELCGSRPELANLCWTLATVPVIAGLAVSRSRPVAGRVGVDAIALISMSAALALGEPLAGAVVALMYSGGDMLEEIAVVRAESSLRALVDRAPRVAHRRVGETIEDRPVERVAVGDLLVVKAGEEVPVDGNVVSPSATIDKSALTGEPIPSRQGQRRAGLQRHAQCWSNLRDRGLRGRRVTALTRAS